jgi:hypothetical protein
MTTLAAVFTCRPFKGATCRRNLQFNIEHVRHNVIICFDDGAKASDSANSPREGCRLQRGFLFSTGANMQCCEVKYFGVYIDPETGAEFMVPVNALYCPVCGTPIIPGA